MLYVGTEDPTLVNRTKETTTGEVRINWKPFSIWLAFDMRPENSTLVNRAKKTPSGEVGVIRKPINIRLAFELDEGERLLGIGV
jgi:hypothetical protein